MANNLQFLGSCLGFFFVFFINTYSLELMQALNFYSLELTGPAHAGSPKQWSKHWLTEV
jgi:hypothetical protein